MVIDGVAKIGLDSHSNDIKKHENGFKDAPESNRPPGLMSVGALGTQAQSQTEEVWVQNKTSEGKFYYYNARTRESAWVKPEGPNTRVITQEQVEQMAAYNAQLQKQSLKESDKKDQMQEIDNKELKSDTTTAVNPLMNTSNPPPSGNFFPPPGMLPPGFAPPFGLPPPGMPHTMMPPPGMFPPTGFPGFPPHMPPFGAPFGMPPFGMMPPHMQGFHKPKTIDEKMRELKGFYDDETLRNIREVEEHLAKLREECTHYTEHETPEGKKYYYNTKSSESTWERPKCFSNIPGITPA